MTDIDNVDQKRPSAGLQAHMRVRLPYEPPALKCERLSLITRGGTPGPGDSGAPTTEEDPTPATMPESDFPGP